MPSDTSIAPPLIKFVRKEARKGVTVVEDKVDSSKEGEKHQKSKETWVVTGRRRQQRYSYDGIGRPQSIIAVPTHFYKVIVVVDVKSSKNDAGNSNTNTNNTMAYSLQQFAAFFLPNTDMIGEKDSCGGMRLVD